MTPTTSSSDRRLGQMYRYTVRQGLGASMLVGIIMLITFPLQFVITWQTGNPRYILPVDALSFHSPLSLLIFLPLAMLFCLVVTFIVFPYFQNHRAAILYFSLPMRRSRLFFAHYLAGYTLAALPVVICYLLVLIANGIMRTGVIHPGDILADMGWVLYTMLAVYTIAVFIAAATGTYFNALLYNLTLHLMPILLYLEMAELLSATLLGFSPSAMLRAYDLMSSLSPFGMLLTRLGQSTNRMIYNPWIPALVWLFLIAFFLICAHNRFRWRRPELAGHARTGGVLPTLCKWGVSIAIGLAFGFYFINTTQNGLLSYLGIFLGSSVSHLVMDVLGAQGFKDLHRSVKSYVILAACFVVVLAVLRTGGFGFESRLPEAEDILQVEIDYTGTQAHLTDAETVTLSDPADIAQLLTFHHSLIDTLLPLRRQVSFVSTLGDLESFRTDAAALYPTITYRLQNGHLLERSYPVGVPRALVSQLAVLETSESFKRQTYPAFQIQPEQVNGVRVRGRFEMEEKESYHFLPEEDYAALLSAMQADILAADYEEIFAPANPPVLLISFWYLDAEGEQHRVESEVYSSWHNTLACLNSLELAKTESGDPSSYIGAFLLETESDDSYYHFRYRSHYFDPALTEGGALDRYPLITDPEEIGALMDTAYVSYGAEEPVYRLLLLRAVDAEGGSSWYDIYYIPKDQLPDGFDDRIIPYQFDNSGTSTFFLLPWDAES